MGQLLGPFRELTPASFETSWSSPANIAFVKYWGKKGHQIPASPSLSMTLKQCKTTTSVRFNPSSSLSVKLLLEGKEEERFAKKIGHYLESLKEELPWIMNLEVMIETSNTFPYGTGIASSASGLSAFALCLCDYLHFLLPDDHRELFLKRASFLARLASGSACRSIYGGFTSWGDSLLPGGGDDYATKIEVHPELSHLIDSVVVVSSTEKIVSSRQGHDRMKDHLFAEARYTQAKQHYQHMLKALQKGDMQVVGEILEKEALALHALMMSSPSPYTLLKPNSLAVMEIVGEFRRETKLPIYFTLDAGPNIHLIYPVAFKNKIHPFITHELKPLAEMIIDDETGEGPHQ